MAVETSLAIPRDSIAILIGAGGRNVSLVAKYAGVQVTTTADDRVQLVPKKAADPPLARRMIASIVAGGILRWFTHPSSTHKYYHVSARAELKDLVAAQTDNKCSLQLLRARSGHLCLFVGINDDVEDPEAVAPLIAGLRPTLLARIAALAQSLP